MGNFIIEIEGKIETGPRLLNLQLQTILAESRRLKLEKERNFCNLLTRNQTPDHRSRLDETGSAIKGTLELA